MRRRTHLDVYFNSKTKVYSDGTTNTVCCSQHIFKSKFDEPAEKAKKELFDYFSAQQKIQNILDYLDARQTMDMKEKERSNNEPRNDSVKRAKDSIFDYVLNNDFDYFFTGTINPEELDSKDPKKLLKPLQKWLQK